MLATLAFLLALGAGVGFAHAQVVDPNEGLSSFASAAGFSTSLSLPVLIARLIRTFISFLGIVAVCFVIYGGFLWMTAAGSEERVTKARQVLINAAIGLVIVFASFAIVQFILGALGSATGGEIIGTGPDCVGSECFPDNVGPGARAFVLQSVNTECASALQNLELQFVFSKPVSRETVENNAGGIRVRKGGTDDVDGVFSVSGRRVTFKPAQVCAGEPTERCFDATTAYEIDLNEAILRSSGSTALTCPTSFPCDSEFTTGTGIDLVGPTSSMDAPEPGASVPVNAIALLQSLAKDDTGVSTVDFTVDGDLVFAAGLADSTGGTLSTQNNFHTDDTQWDTAGLLTNKSHSIRAIAYDCSGRSDTSPPVSVFTRAASCFNSVTDTDFGETDVDCGGSSSSEFFCGACIGEQCTSDADCSSGSCENGFCVGSLRIDSVSSGDGAPGNLVTIAGRGFGTTPGTVTFLGIADAGDDQQTSAFNCVGSIRWADGEIIVEVPADAADGPILVTSSGDLSDRTDTEPGAFIADFDVNTTVRPGLCAATPATATSGTSVTAIGRNLGATQGTSTLYFASQQASAYPRWSASEVDGVVPTEIGGRINLQAFVGNNVCSTAGTLCANDAACPANETCLLGREGSNKISFQIISAAAGTTPNIASLDTGWKVCSDASAIDLRGDVCTTDADCGTGTCVDASNWGPPGQYVTIVGTNFGTAIGQVRFESGDEPEFFANASTDFPPVCEASPFWRDSSITVKVPAAFTNTATATPVTPNDYRIFVHRSDGIDSQKLDFFVVDGTAGPAVCSVEPSSGPANTLLTISGENFGLSAAKGLFSPGNLESSAVSQTQSVSAGDQMQGVSVPDAAQTGFVQAKTSGNAVSNRVPFTVSDCREAGNACASGACCGDGTCRANCAAGEPRVSHFAWKFSTGPIPNAPRVIEQCTTPQTGESPSPSPWERWPDEVCINAAVRAAFTVPVDGLTDANIRVQRCLDGADPACVDRDLVPGAMENPVGESVFSWAPTANFAENTRYVVTLNGGTAVDELFGSVTPIQAREDSEPMEQDYVFSFRTANNATLCEVGSVAVSPSEKIIDTEGGTADYLASPLAEGRSCIALRCADPDYTYEWSVDIDHGSKASVAPVNGICGATATALNQTDPGSPALVQVDLTTTITTTTTTTRERVSGSGELIIDYTDPDIAGYFPNCQTACIDVLPSVTFNTPMSASFNPNWVQLTSCNNEACTGVGAVPPPTHRVVYNVQLKRAQIQLGRDRQFEANSFYKISVSPLAESASGVRLAVKRPTGFSWVFRTKNSNVSCGVDHVDVVPQGAVATYVGQRQEFTARIFGAPDECSLSGQELDPNGRDWNEWASADDPDRVTGTTANERIASLLGTPPTGGDLAFSSDLPAGCTESCTNAGAPITAGISVCGDGVVDDFEDCDGGNATDGDGCSSQCLNEGSALTCGDGLPLDSFEDCDDGNVIEGDGCSATCLSEGATKNGFTCGNGDIAIKANGAGEECDDGNGSGGDGCSAECLNEGSAPETGVYATCGNGPVGSPEPGEDCDDGNTANGDGCSSRCLAEGTRACVSECVGGANAGQNCVSDGQCDGGSCDLANAPCCGDNSVGIGEICDGGNAVSGDGCSSSCRLEGSSALYPTASFCGDGVAGTGEFTVVGRSCESSPSGLNMETGAYAVAQTDRGAVRELVAAREQDPNASQVSSTITATVESKTGDGAYALSCACTRDDSCGVAADGTELGCGVANCCFERPEANLFVPSGGSNICRNAAVYVGFSQVMDPASLVSADGRVRQVYLELRSIGATSVTSATCPASHQFLAQFRADDSQNAWYVRAWHWVKDRVSAFFGGEAEAAASGCITPAELSVEPAGDGTSKVRVKYSELLIPGGSYQIVVIGDSLPADAVKEGVQSVFGVGLSAAQRVGSVFTVGNEICTLDEVIVEDIGRVETLDDPNSPLAESPGFISSANEAHRLTASAFTLHGGVEDEIYPIPNVYSWAFVWGSSIPDANADNIITVTNVDISATPIGEADAAANEKDGQENVIASATIQTDGCGTAPNPPCAEKSGSLKMTALLCDNPWPSLSDPSLTFPFTDATGASPTNFGFYYCRDAGVPGLEGDLPELNVTTVGSPPSTDIVKEFIFVVEGTGDAVGVRVLGQGDPTQNEEYLPPDLWYAARGFTGTPTATTVDGYDAVRDGNTVYAVAANQTGGIFPNVYVISTTTGAGAEAEQIFDQVLTNFRFNMNTNASGAAVVSDNNICVETYLSGMITIRGLGIPVYSQRYVHDANGTFVPCSADAECGGGSRSCDADKAKLTRDLRRLTDLQRMKRFFDVFGTTNRHCSLNVAQACLTAAHCGASGGSCVADVPTLAEGSFIRAFTTSAWPSWNAALGTGIKRTLPEDPLNEILCGSQILTSLNAELAAQTDTAGRERVQREIENVKASCFNPNALLQSGTRDAAFSCVVGSHVYGFKSVGGDEYELTAELEYNRAPWGLPLDKSLTDNSTIQAEYAVTPVPGSLPNGFLGNAALCNGTVIGASLVCGDGVKGTGEECEIGEVKPETIDCKTDPALSANNGTKSPICVKAGDTCRFELPTETLSACIPTGCGNGTKEPLAGEVCDDGANNGKYGFCGPDCTTAGSFYCGDGKLAGAEQCDCGNAANASTLAGDSSSWAYNNCKTGSTLVTNGQYNQNIAKSCEFDCTKPGPSCGDGELNGDEFCDGDVVKYAGKICNSADRSPCETNADCGGAVCGGDTLSACGRSRLCLTGNAVSFACLSDAECTVGVCQGGSSPLVIGRLCQNTNDCRLNGSNVGSTCVNIQPGTCSPGLENLKYDTARTRSCSTAAATMCTWNNWSACRSGDFCGDGTKQGTEECDDGNPDNNDACTTSCKANFCGDGFVYRNVESCDLGLKCVGGERANLACGPDEGCPGGGTCTGGNGEACDAPYNGFCNSCTVDCTLRTSSGPFCGDSMIDANEVCDQATIKPVCFNANASITPPATEVRIIGDACSKPGEAGGTGRECSDTQTCRFVGICNGGTDHGRPCTLANDPVGTGYTVTTGDQANCTGGVCMKPVCADSCFSACPFSMVKERGLLMRTNEPNSLPTDEITIRKLGSSHDPDDPQSPLADRAELFLPACNYGQSLSATIEFLTDEPRALPPNLDIVFVIDRSGSMGSFASGGSDPSPMEVTREATKSALASLRQVDAANPLNEIRFALVAFGQGATVLHNFTQDQGMDGLEIKVDTISASDGMTQTSIGMQEGLNLLNAVPADHGKVMILLSDGQPSSDGGMTTTVRKVKNTSGQQLDPDIQIYTATIGSGGLAGFMAHISSDGCTATNFNEPQLNDQFDTASDCQPNNGTEYAYSGTTPEAVERMFELIVERIQGVTFGAAGRTDQGAAFFFSRLETGVAVPLAIPPGACNGQTEALIPISIACMEDCIVKISNVEFSHCPAR